MASAATLTSSGGSDLGFVSDWNRESYWSVQPFSPQWVRLDFGATRVEANGVELWPGAMNAFFPRRYVLTASDGASVCSARTSPSTDVFAGAAASSRLPCVTITTDGGAAEVRHNASSARATGYSSLQ